MSRLKSNPVHVMIGSPKDFRRHVLLGGVDAIRSLEYYEHFKKLKNLKKKKFLELNERINSINHEFTRLLDVMPELREKKVLHHIKKVNPREEVISKAGKGSKERDLEREMRDIRYKLSSLNF